MGKVLTQKILLINLLIYILFSCNNNQDTSRYDKKIYDILIREGTIKSNFIYKYTGEVFLNPDSRTTVLNFNLKITNIKNKISTNYLLPTIKTPVFELKDIDNDREKDIFIVYYTGGMHVFTYEQLIFSSKYKRLFIYNAEEIGINVFGKPTINYSPSKYPEIHNFFKTNIKNMKKYKEKFKKELNPTLFKRIKNENG